MNARPEPFDQHWVEQVLAHCDRVFAQADVGFMRQVQHTDPTETSVAAILWEADPGLFVERYPDTDILASYNAKTPGEIPCLDFWVYLEPDNFRARLSIEGFEPSEHEVALTGHGGEDGRILASAFARILRVDNR